jgi:hypothetical protein
VGPCWIGNQQCDECDDDVDGQRIVLNATPGETVNDYSKASEQ